MFEFSFCLAHHDEEAKGNSGKFEAEDGFMMDRRLVEQNEFRAFTFHKTIKLENTERNKTYRNNRQGEEDDAEDLSTGL